MKKSICPLILLGFALVTVLTGCGDKSKAPASPPETGGSALTAPVDHLGAMARAEQSAVKTVDTASLSAAIRMFEADQGKLPKDLNELVEKKFLPKIPETPFGTKLDYNPATGEIKVIKQ